MIPTNCKEAYNANWYYTLQLIVDIVQKWRPSHTAVFRVFGSRSERGNASTGLQHYKCSQSQCSEQCYIAERRLQYYRADNTRTIWPSCICCSSSFGYLVGIFQQPTVRFLCWW